jgi:hypothetical protein
MAWGTVGWDQTGGGGGADPLVPNLVGLTEAEALTILTTTGFIAGTDTTAASQDVASGDVISQNPASNTIAAQGSAVDYVVSTGANVASFVQYEQTVGPASMVDLMTYNAISPMCGDTLPNGNIAIVNSWYDDATYYIACTVVNSAMAIQSEVITTACIRSPSYSPLMCALEGGNVAWLYVDDYNYWPWMGVFDGAGNVVMQPTSIDETERYDGGWSITALKDGGFVTFTVNGGTRCTIHNADGTIRKAAFLLEDEWTTSICEAVGMADGNFIVFWASDGRYSIYEPVNGVKVSGDFEYFTLRNPRSSEQASARLNPIDNSVCLVFTTQTDTNEEQITLTTVNADGSLRFRDKIVYTRNFVTGRFRPCRQAMLSNGSGLCITAGPLNTARYLYFCQWDISGTVIPVDSEISTGFGTSNGNGIRIVSTQFGDGKILLVHDDLSEGYVVLTPVA